MGIDNPDSTHNENRFNFQAPPVNQRRFGSTPQPSNWQFGPGTRNVWELPPPKKKKKKNKTRQR